MDHLKTLGVAADASKEDIKKKYRALVLELHPDRLPPTTSEAARAQAVEQFKAITEAYDVLTDDSKRAAWQRSRTSSSSAASYGTTYGSAYGYGSTTSANYEYSRYSRPSTWQLITRRLSTRPLEVIFCVAVAGVAGLGLLGVDNFWNSWNKGKRFEDIQRARTSYVASLQAGGGEEEEASDGAAGNPLRAGRMSRGCGSRTAHIPRGSTDPQPTQAAG